MCWMFCVQMLVLPEVVVVVHRLLCCNGTEDIKSYKFRYRLSGRDSSQCEEQL